MKVAVVLLLAVARWCVVEAALDHKWYSSAPVLPAVVASSEHIADPRCYNHSKMFLRALDNHTLWAVQMLDASVKVPHGILDGSVSDLGHFDQCLAVSVDDLRGQYCLVEISYGPVSYSPTQTTDPYSLQFDSKVHAWEKLKGTEDRSRIPRSTLYLGLCMPSSCSPDQLQESLQHELRLLGEKEGLIFKARVSPLLCATEQESPPWSVGEIVFSCSIGLLSLLVFISSWYDRSRQKTDQSSAVEQVLLCFSIQRSVAGLLKVTSVIPALDFMDVYRLVFSVLIILGHRVLIHNALIPVSDANQHEQLFRSWSKSLLISGTAVVDFFFVASGTLFTFHTLNHLHAHKSVNLLSVMASRFIRLAPIYMTVLSFYATLFYRMGSGPLWESVVGVERGRCQDNWWTNLLYINNYVNADSMITSHLCFVALTLVAVGNIMAAYPLYRPGSSSTYIEAGLYASLSRVFGGISWGGVILLGHFGTLGFLKDFTLWKPFRVLGRLMYGVYLVHMLGQIYNMGSLRTPQQTGVFHIWWRVMGDVMFSFALSFLLTVMLESPVRNLEKLVLQRNLREAKDQERKKL